ncbi:radical SAM protein [Pelotomaculum propionicicum]|uniref:Sporulation killing factor maturation protein SkfB n=1 Tax=Pelotomaculum propionicicum TaxID=258475 RepID=A0A4Y7RT94_9FIRM|nr:radical SAM protein [Pelotomaculum propionicicum]NLI13260.1 radical SAM protein [Peptococcaceae bacterium]TEB12103.1 Sporulation killing factor maturation protein SkfB [Pelotomaculum propionicicum]
MSLATKVLGETTLKMVVNYANKNPEKGIQSLLNLAARIPFDPVYREMVRDAEKAFQNKNNNWYQLFMRFFREAHPRVRERLFTNMFLNAWFLGVPKQREMSEKLGVNIPFALLVDQTSRCNLRCTGCWAGDYSKEQELNYTTFVRICGEARELGIYFIVISGGEPLMNKDVILRLAARYPDMVFHVYTNGTLIDDRFAEEVARLGNIAFAISLEGFRENTDKRRGQGVFDRVMKAMDTLHKAGVIFGFSATYTRYNTEEVGSEEFWDLMIKMGCTFGWYFTYIPIGRDINLDMMATPEQRAFMYRQVQRFRKTKPIAVIDFWNDGEAVNGCIAGGRRYLHINAAGEVEPCAFVHYATDNIKNISLLEALKSPLMQAYQKRQPFNSNMLRPCPIIDNPEALAEIVAETGARSTQINSNGGASELAKKLRDYSRAWGREADMLIESKQKAKALRKVVEYANIFYYHKSS